MKPNAQRLREIEAQIARIANVSAASIQIDDRGEIDAVDVIADRGRAPQRIKRDVEIVLRQGGLDVDHRKIGIAVLDDPDALLQRRADEAAPPPAEGAARGPEPDADVEMAVIELAPDPERIRVVAVHSSLREGSFTAEVELCRGAFEAIPGRAEGPAGDDASCARVVARATVEAVRNLLRPGYHAQLRELRVVELGTDEVVVLTVDFGEGRSHRRVTGACLQNGSLLDAAVYATLDALNRPLGRARFREFTVLAAADGEAGDLGEDRAGA